MSKVEDSQIEYYKKLEEILNDLAKKQQKKKLMDIIINWYKAY